MCDSFVWILLQIGDHYSTLSEPYLFSHVLFTFGFLSWITWILSYAFAYWIRSSHWNCYELLFTFESWIEKEKEISEKKKKYDEKKIP